VFVCLCVQARKNSRELKKKRHEQLLEAERQEEERLRQRRERRQQVLNPISLETRACCDSINLYTATPRTECHDDMRACEWVYSRL